MKRLGHALLVAFVALLVAPMCAVLVGGPAMLLAGSSGGSGGGGGGGIGGSTGSTDNRPLCADGTGGTALKACTAAAFPMGAANAPSITLGTSSVGWYRDADVGANYWGFTASTPSFRLGLAEFGLVKNGRITFGNQVNSFTSSSETAALSQGPAGTISIEYGVLRMPPLASPPYTCNAGAEGDEYNDTSHAKCWCSGSAWTVVAGAGTCA